MEVEQVWLAVPVVPVVPVSMEDLVSAAPLLTSRLLLVDLLSIDLNLSHLLISLLPLHSDLLQEVVDFA